MKPYRRAQRVGEEIQRILAEALAHDVRDPRLSGVTLLRVEVTSDLRNATVFYTTRSEPEKVLEGFKKAKGFLRGLLAKRLEIRAVPELIFREIEEEDW
jgi:ribosome-binding factor A